MKILYVVLQIVKILADWLYQKLTKPVIDREHALCMDRENEARERYRIITREKKSKFAYMELNLAINKYRHNRDINIKEKTAKWNWLKKVPSTTKAKTA